MNNLSAKIGDQIQVTFVRLADGVRAQQRVNSRPVFADSRSMQPRPGDTCMIKIVAENPDKTVYYAFVVAVVRVGDGVSSILEKVVDVIDRRVSGSHQFDPVGTTRGIELARQYFGEDRVGLIEFLTEVIEYYRYENSPLDYVSFERLARTIEELIEEALASDHEAAARAYLNVGGLLAIGERQYQQGATYINKALARSEKAGGGAVRLEVLAEIERVSGGRFKKVEEFDLTAVLQELIAVAEKSGSVDLDRRLKTARLLLADQKPEAARAMLEPVMKSTDSSIDVIQFAAQKMAESYRQEGNDSEFLGWQLVAGLRRHADFRAVADVLSAQGRHEAAAEHYRQAYEILKKECGSDSEDR